jgi:L-amino acid N-acyltransferase YncA
VGEVSEPTRINIRAAILEDAQSIAKVHVTSWRAAYAGVVPQAHLDSLDEAQFSERWQHWITSETSAVFCVAEVDGALCGFASAGPIRKQSFFYDAELYAVYLLPEMQRQGIGRGLFDYIADELVAQKLHHLLLWSLRDNPSTGFYRRLGGELVAEDVCEIGGETLSTVAFGWKDIANRSWR